MWARERERVNWIIRASQGESTRFSNPHPQEQNVARSGHGEGIEKVTLPGGSAVPTVGGEGSTLAAHHCIPTGIEHEKLCRKIDYSFKCHLWGENNISGTLIDPKKLLLEA